MAPAARHGQAGCIDQSMNIERGFLRIVIALSATAVAAGVAVDAASSPTWRVAVRATLGDGRQYATVEPLGGGGLEERSNLLDRSAVATRLNRRSPPIDPAPQARLLFQKLRGEIPAARGLSDEDLSRQVRPAAESLDRLRKTHPEYDDIPDEDLVRRITAKYPQCRGAFGDVVKAYSFTLCLKQPPFVRRAKTRDAAIDAYLSDVELWVPTRVLPEDIQNAEVLWGRSLWMNLMAGWFGVAIAALLWLAFYSVRWIARGFARI